MAKIEINDAALQKLLAPAVAAAEAAVTKVSRSHAGQPEDEVERALVHELKQIGVEPGEDLPKIARKIADS